MARARNIKPGFYKNEDLAECSVWARYIFPGLWMLADREGRLEDRPKRIKAELLAFDTQDVDPLLNELQERGFLVRYRNSDGSFIQISKFSTHQAPHYSEKPSVIKPPDSRNVLPIKGVSPPNNSGKAPPIKEGSQPPDSLIPDSLNPESLGTTLSGKPDDAWLILEFLNGKTGKQFRPVTANLTLIRARLKEGATADDCRAVIARKFREWKGSDMEKYLRPATLFNREKFAQYSGELEKVTP